MNAPNPHTPNSADESLEHLIEAIEARVDGSREGHERVGRRNLWFGGGGLAAALGVIWTLHTEMQGGIEAVKNEIVQLRILTAENGRLHEDMEKLERLFELDQGRLAEISLRESVLSRDMDELRRRISKLEEKSSDTD